MIVASYFLEPPCMCTCVCMQTASVTFCSLPLPLKFVCFAVNKFGLELFSWHGAVSAPCVWMTLCDVGHNHDWKSFAKHLSARVRGLRCNERQADINASHTVKRVCVVGGVRTHRIYDPPGMITSQSVTLTCLPVRCWVYTCNVKRAEIDTADPSPRPNTIHQARGNHSSTEGLRSKNQVLSCNKMRWFSPQPFKLCWLLRYGGRSADLPLSRPSPVPVAAQTRCLMSGFRTSPKRFFPQTSLFNSACQPQVTT